MQRGSHFQLVSHLEDEHDQETLPCCHLALAAFLAEADLSSFVILAARASPPFLPPFRPSATACGFFLFFMKRIML
jgi:hypothetical protein